MDNFIQNGDVVTVPAPAAVTSGDGVKVGMIFGVAQKDADNGDDVAVVTRGVFTLPKTSAQAWSVGDAIYWNNSSGVCTTATSAGNIFIGVAAAAAANPSATGVVRLNGAMPAAAEA
ncbi:MAG: DUF2190 family protein [Roseicyclus sp.]